jgi:hypothetical protein
LAKSKSTLRLFDKLTAQGERSQQAFSSELVEESGRTDLLLQRAMDE